MFAHTPECDKNRYWRMNTRTLQKEYLSLQRAIFCRMFGHNAAQAQAFVGMELHKRGVFKIPNALGDIQVKTVPYR